MNRFNCHLCFIIAFAIKATTGTAQPTQPTNWVAEANLAYDTAQYSKANTAKHAEYLNQEEKDLILLANLAKLDGKIFYERLLSKYLIENRKKETPHTLSLIETLKKTAQSRMLRPHIDLFRSAEFHALDMGKSGKTGHVSSDGTDPFTRAKRFYPDFSAENCSYGWNSAMDILCQLLIDEGIESLGHRDNILRNGGLIGVAIRPHVAYWYNCVMDFGSVPLSEIFKPR